MPVRFARLITLLLLLSPLVGNVEGTVTAFPYKQNQATQWTVFSPPDDSFSLSFPGVPIKTRPPVSDPETIEAGFYLLKTNDAYYVLAYKEFGFSVDVPGPSEKIIDAELNSIASSGQSVFTEKKEISFAGYPGRMFSIQHGQDYTRGEILAIRRRVYLFAVIFPHNNAGANSSKEQNDAIAAKFTSSFKLKPVKPVELDSDAWRAFAATDHSFNIQLPAPSRETTDVMEIAGRQIKAHTIKAESNFASYVIIYADMPVASPDPALIKRMFDLGRLERQGNVPAKDISEKEISVAGSMGRELVMESDYGMIKARYFIINQRMYALAITVRKDVYAQPDAQRYFDQAGNQFLASFAPTNSAKPKEGGNN